MTTSQLPSQQIYLYFPFIRSLIHIRALPLSATTYFLKVGDTDRRRCHPCSGGFWVMLEVWAPWLLEVILKARCCGFTASLWAVSISLVVIPPRKPKNRVMAHYMMESWTSPQNVTPTLLQLDLITTAMHRCVCLTWFSSFSAPLILFSKLCRAAVPESLFRILEQAYGADSQRNVASKWVS